MFSIPVRFPFLIIQLTNPVPPLIDILMHHHLLPMLLKLNYLNHFLSLQYLLITFIYQTIELVSRDINMVLFQIDIHSTGLINSNIANYLYEVKAHIVKKSNNFLILLINISSRQSRVISIRSRFYIPSRLIKYPYPFICLMYFTLFQQIILFHIYILYIISSFAFYCSLVNQ